MSNSLWSREAEQTVIGAILCDEKAWDMISGIVTSEMFFFPPHRLIFAAAQALATRGKPTDALSVSSSLKLSQQSVDAGGSEYLMELVKSTSGIWNIATHAEIVRDRNTMRRLHASISTCEAILSDESLSLGERAAKASLAILDAADEATEDIELFTVKQGLADLHAKLETDHARGGGLAGLSTGFQDLDDRMMGMAGGEMIVLAARPGKGKTNLGLNIATFASKSGKRTIFFSMEMSKGELANRIACAEGNIRSRAIATLDWDAFAGPLSNFIARSDGYSMLIDDKAGQTMGRINLACKKAKRTLGGLDLIVIDYLQLIKGEGKSRYEQVTNISRDIKILAKDFDVPVLCLAQLNRGPEGGKTKPKASDLRDSGAIEQDADVVMLIHSDDKPDGTSADFSEIIFDKVRRGSRGTDVLLQDFAHSRFRPTTLQAFKESRPEENNQKTNRRGGYND
jgi:replicative DNA helicase